MLAATADGAFAGPFLLTRLSGQARRPRVVFAAFGLRGVVDVVLATATALAATLAALVCYGLSTSTRLVSLLVGGLLADSLGISAVYYADGVLLFAAAAAGLSLARR